MQRKKAINGWCRKRRDRRGAKPHSDAKLRRKGGYRRTSDATYRVHVSDAGRGTWATFLTQMTTRPGWSVARLAREAGIHRSTIFRWIKGDGGLTLQSVRAIAHALNVDPEVALLAAGNLIQTEPQQRERDPEIELIMAAPVDDATRRRMLERLAMWRQRDEARIVELRRQDQERRVADLRWLLDEETAD